VLEYPAPGVYIEEVVFGAHLRTVRGFFENGGKRCSIALIAATDPVEAALEALSNEPVSMLCCPDENEFSTAARVLTERCEARKDRGNTSTSAAY
jgi:hypothetical protein